MEVEEDLARKEQEMLGFDKDVDGHVKRLIRAELREVVAGYFSESVAMCCYKWGEREGKR